MFWGVYNAIYREREGERERKRENSGKNGEDGVQVVFNKKEKITTFLSNLYRKSLQKRIKSFY